MKRVLFALVAFAAAVSSPAAAFAECNEFTKLACVDGCQDGYPTDNALFAACLKRCYFDLGCGNNMDTIG